MVQAMALRLGKALIRWGDWLRGIGEWLVGKPLVLMTYVSPEEWWESTSMFHEGAEGAGE